MTGFSDQHRVLGGWLSSTSGGDDLPWLLFILVATCCLQIDVGRVLHFS